MSETIIVCPEANRPEALKLGKRRRHNPRPQRFEKSISARHPGFAEDASDGSVKFSAAFDERTVLIDLTEVTWVDSWGLALFIEASQRIRAHGGALIFFGVHDNLQRLFATTKLDQIFHIASSRDEAMASASGPCRNESKRD